MNSLYTLGVRQTSSIQADLEKLRAGDNSASLHGQIAASLAALHRTIEDYDSMARREMLKAKQEKAQMRLQKFRTDYSELMGQFDSIKRERDAAQKTELFASATPNTAGSARQRFANGPTRSTAPPELVGESPFRSATPNGSVMPGSTLDREAYALREHSFAQTAHAQLDDFIAQGREVLDNLVDQRNMLKGTQRRLLDAANTLGLSRDVIGWIERRSTQDMYIFFGGAVFTFFCFYLIWKYLG
ncbi:golgi SNAP receptor complex member bos1 [Fomitiporia mediterranea MF3/22]|uniref:golgi SNAP receptor complex member bos1 n=1 Tax=Fomitiporia mediterranea (strain MF3/22) TaxID=694068 RepID=UPI0004408E3D|nr:golgi SNAP receptor complex member bos1 [Fomitiporia mediterranea MF3/22]EJD02981.1 golgi SNAP receptor complex member bos1 [Fomitiporia mediterranea MF3/22]